MEKIFVALTFGILFLVNPNLCFDLVLAAFVFSASVDLESEMALKVRLFRSVKTTTSMGTAFLREARVSSSCDFWNEAMAISLQAIPTEEADRHFAVSFHAALVSLPIAN